MSFWDHEDCPRDDCAGELQQQDRFNVMCLSCESVWTHVKTDTMHYLQTADFEAAAEEPVVMTDGGRDTATARSGQSTNQIDKIVAHHTCVDCSLDELGRSAAEYHVESSGHQTEPVYL